MNDDGAAAPKRVQQRRTKGWRKPDGAVSVARPSRWGNPYVIGPSGDAEFPHEIRGVVTPGHLLGQHRTMSEARAHAVYLYEINIVEDLDLTPLRGKDLMCFCPLNQSCHADVLLEYANEGAHE